MGAEGRTLLLVCQNVDCKSRGSTQILQQLEEAFKDNEQVEVKTYMCFGTCQDAPNVVVYPQRDWYSGIQMSDVAEIIEAVRRGERIERICDKVDRDARELIYNLLDAGIY